MTGARPDGGDGFDVAARHGGDVVRFQPQLADVHRLRQRRQGPHLRPAPPPGGVHRVVERLGPTDDAGRKGLIGDGWEWEWDVILVLAPSWGLQFTGLKGGSQVA